MHMSDESTAHRLLTGGCHDRVEKSLRGGISWMQACYADITVTYVLPMSYYPVTCAISMACSAMVRELGGGVTLLTTLPY